MFLIWLPYLKQTYILKIVQLNLHYSPLNKAQMTRQNYAAPLDVDVTICLTKNSTN